MVQHRPHTTVVLAMSADGKIADFRRSPARFGTSVDKTHLEEQIAASDAVLIGAGTLRAYGTTLTVSDTVLLQQRQQQGKPDQPIHIVITHSANLNPEIRFFQQPIRRWLVTTNLGKNFWQGRSEFERILVFETPTGEIDTITVLKQLTSLQIARLLVLGGGALVASMLELDLIDEFWLTVCPLILGGVTAPTPVDGKGFTSQLAPHLQLLEVKKVEHEVFLHYQLQR
ncbi:bifunctional deaminase-reductase-like protein [Trichormus variabilis ATCC 29413]|uniref:Bifunctional deaminase-reductase-like protein n=2 Tax=Anabaena variabilis TaxID=264691 RepID=Q3MF09_TRIV2|nr:MULTISPECIES: RibD family protein [Nostocaceae]ABA20427.1 bifunctional deaminase-reductase-like protein [Trichormus variabilis ATCC 29413]MBC1216731.1 RibD family protein [Trichormus variabilis ARAD]MBC1257891.1 RibD family protein [Trichormus variabilis V5]MBC1270012.1 RibD family protein [Trichormus variabilis FSR]MBC1304480.1 RibD family protein [Trichormus variabilis N2B]